MIGQENNAAKVIQDSSSEDEGEDTNVKRDFTTSALKDVPDDIAQILMDQNIIQEEEEDLHDDKLTSEDENKEIIRKSKLQFRKKKSSEKKKHSVKSHSIKRPKKTTYFDYSESQNQIDLFQRKRQIMEQKAMLQGYKFKTTHSNLVESSEDEQVTNKLRKKQVSFAQQDQEEESKTDWGLYQVDRASNLQDTCHIYEDYSATLNLTDVGYGQKGHNKFYILQLIEAKNCNKWYCYFKWGRIGTKTPQDSLQQFKSKMDAIRCFQAKFKSKTYNQWSKRRTHFKPAVGKYQLVEVQAKQIQALTRIKKKNKLKEMIQISAKKYKPKCERSIGMLMEMIFDEKRMEKTLSDQNINLKKCPLGLLGRKQINEGYRVLKKIMHVLIERQKNGNGGSQLLKVLIPLSNQFYTTIPHDFGFQRPPPITRLANVKNKISLLDTLLDIQLAREHLLDNIDILHSSHPQDFYYKTLNSRLQQIDPNSQIYKTIQRATKTTSCHGYKIDILKIFGYFRVEELIRFMPFMMTKSDNYLLWHGSRLSNIAGILTEGLRVAPEEAPRTGYMFGKGIYFADIASKAANYCHTEREQNQQGILILTEVGIGRSYKAYKNEYLSEPPQGHISVKGVGRVAPQNIETVQNQDTLLLDRILEFTKEENEDDDQSERIEQMKDFLVGDCKLGLKDSKIFIGEVQDNKEDLKEDGVETELHYNEYVVYEEAQTRIRFIVHWKRRV